jgi:putative transposase
LGRRFSSPGRSKTAEATLEEALIHRFGHLGRTTKPIILRSDNGLAFTSKRYTKTVRSYGLTQKFITPYTPERNGIVERFRACARRLHLAAPV